MTRDDFEPGLEPSLLRVPPHSAEAESALLGGLLLNNAHWDRISDLVVEADFYRHAHRLVFASLGSLINACKPADVVTVYEHLAAQGKAEDAGGLAYLNALAQMSHSAGAMRAYAETVRDRALARRLIAAADEIASSGFSDQNTPITQRIDDAQAKILGLARVQDRDDWQDVDAGMAAMLDRLQDTETADFIPTGLAELDQRLDGGLRGGELMVVGARPSMGKSALALTIARHVALIEGLPVGLFSMEMPKAQLWNRLIALTASVHLSNIKRPERLRDGDWTRITEAVDRLRLCALSISDQTGLTIGQVRSKARALHRRHGRLGLLVVDYLGLMNGTDPKISRAYQLEEATKGLKELAKELGCPVLLLVQLSRKVEERTDQMPMLSDIRDAGSVEQDADIVLFLHRPIKANPSLGPEWQDYAKCSLAKARDGETGLFPLAYYGKYTHFANWPQEQPVPSTGGKTSRGAL